MNCGKEIQDDWQVCPYCLKRPTEERPIIIQQNPPPTPAPIIIKEKEKKSFFYWCGICVFIIILYVIFL